MPAPVAGCPDCGAVSGDPHDEACDVARCLFTGGQRLQCHGLHVDEPAPGCYVPRDCGRDTWTGSWPGEAECAEYGWYAYLAPPGPGEVFGQWVPCARDDPGAGPDLNRLVLVCSWDREQRKWVQA